MSANDEKVNFVSDATNVGDGPSCHVCGTIMQKAEKGWKCGSCRSVTVPADVFLHP